MNNFPLGKQHVMVEWEDLTCAGQEQLLLDAVEVGDHIHHFFTDFPLDILHYNLPKTISVDNIIKQGNLTVSDIIQATTHRKYSRLTCLVDGRLEVFWQRLK